MPVTSCPKSPGGTATSHSVARASRSSGSRVLVSYSSRRPGSFIARSALAPLPDRWSLSFMVISVPPGPPADQPHQPPRLAFVVGISACTGWDRGSVRRPTVAGTPPGPRPPARPVPAGRAAPPHRPAAPHHGAPTASQPTAWSTPRRSSRPPTAASAPLPSRLSVPRHQQVHMQAGDRREKEAGRDWSCGHDGKITRGGVLAAGLKVIGRGRSGARLRRRAGGQRVD